MVGAALCLLDVTLLIRSLSKATKSFSNARLIPQLSYTCDILLNSHDFAIGVRSCYLEIFVN